jgi:hypothetical protein
MKMESESQNRKRKSMNLEYGWREKNEFREINRSRNKFQWMKLIEIRAGKEVKNCLQGEKKKKFNCLKTAENVFKWIPYILSYHIKKHGRKKLIKCNCIDYDENVTNDKSYLLMRWIYLYIYMHYKIPIIKLSHYIFNTRYQFF